ASARGRHAQGRRPPGARRAQRGEGPHERRQGRQHPRAGAAAVGCFGLGGDGRSPRGRRHAAYQVPRSGSVGWGVEEVGGLAHNLLLTTEVLGLLKMRFVERGSWINNTVLPPGAAEFFTYEKLETRTIDTKSRYPRP